MWAGIPIGMCVRTDACRSVEAAVATGRARPAPRVGALPVVNQIEVQLAESAVERALAGDAVRRPDLP